MQQYEIGSDQVDLVFNDWLSRTCIDFIRSDSNYLLTLDASLAPGANFEHWIQELLDELPESLEAISICPSHPSAQELLPGTTEPLKTSHGVNSMGFVLTRSGAQKFIKTFDQCPSGDFSQLISDSKISCATILESSPFQPVHFLDILNSQKAYESQLREERVEPAQIGQEQTHRLDKAPVKVQAFISHWYSTWNNIEKVESACREFGYETTVLNTTIHDKQGWANSIPISFFRQFEYACKNFDPTNEYMLFITADVKSDKWGEFFAYADQVLRLENVGTFTPTLSFELRIINRFPTLHLDSEKPLAIIFQNDIIVTYIHRKVIEEYRLFLEHFNLHQDTFDPQVGWGLDTILAILMHSLELYSVRDRSHALLHGSSHSYSHDIAGKEWNDMSLIAADYLAKRGIPELGIVQQNILESIHAESFKSLVRKLGEIQ
jgi:hypothetical protein